METPIYTSNALRYLPDALGIVGVVLVLSYYFLLQTGKCQANSLAFSMGNFVGSILLLISLWFSWNIASVSIELAWCLISLFGIIRYFRGSNR